MRSKSQKSEHDTICALARRIRLLPAIYEPCERESSKWRAKRGVTSPVPAPYSCSPYFSGPSPHVVASRSCEHITYPTPYMLTYSICRRSQAAAKMISRAAAEPCRQAENEQPCSATKRPCEPGLALEDAGDRTGVSHFPSSKRRATLDRAGPLSQTMNDSGISAQTHTSPPASRTAPPLRLRLR